MRALISGGCKMGKSTLAQRLAAVQGEGHVYVATMRPRDTEDEERIARHRREREGWGFRTVECPTGIEQLLTLAEASESLLLDSTTALLAEEMFSADGRLDSAAPERIMAALTRVLDRFAHMVIVSDTIFSDARRFDPATEAYRKGLADIDRALAAQCDAVLEMTFGQAVIHKGGMAFDAWLKAAQAQSFHA